MTTTERQTKKAAPPAWWLEAEGAYQDGIASCFILHWNIGDWVVHGIDTKGFLEKVYRERHVVFYSRAAGFHFGAGEAGAEAKKHFLIACGLSAAPQMPNQQGPAPDPLARMAAPSVALPLMDKALRQAEVPLVLVIDYAESIAPQTEWGSMTGEDRTALVTLLSWARSDVSAAFGHPVYLLTRNVGDLHQDLRAASSNWFAVEVPLPGTEERAEYAGFLAERIQMVREAEAGAGNAVPDHAVLGISAEELGRLSAGMGRRNIEDVFLRARRAHVPVTAELLKERKHQIIRSEFEEVLEVWDPEGGFETVGGHEHVKEYFRSQVIAPLLSGNTQRVPPGILLMGPSGTGKSLIARAVAKESGLNCLKFDPSKIFAGIVGATERNLSRALAGISTMTPVLVFIDEVDQQSVNRGEGGDNGVSGRVFGMMIDFMARPENRGRVVWLAATNRPDLLDAAFKAPHRFPAKIPMLPPNLGERVEVLRVLCQAAGLFPALPPPALVEAMAGETENWTGAELSALVRKAKQRLDDGKATKLEDALASAKASMRPTTQAIEYMSLLAIQECNDLDLLPPDYREIAADPMALVQKMRGIEQELPEVLDTPTKAAPSRRL